ncbi:uncharacterized protein LOC116159347 [Photinus pyralis]|uniref:Uncharacterized protein n=1 Tax=Photinus pyralis TaxID=7054 RepID=A0A1Y1KV57_PHOPY|nr:uncharacterized protein LOC116159347 [Photinus pyralis]
MMKVTTKYVLLIDFLLVNIYVAQAKVIPNEIPHKCVSHGVDYKLLEELPKFEVVNKFVQYPLKEVLPPRDFLPEGNQVYNNYLRCVWKSDRLMFRNDDVNYNRLEEYVKKAITSVVGSTGPAINLSTLHSKEIVEGCKSIGGDPGTKVIRMQNYIIARLQHLVHVL